VRRRPAFWIAAGLVVAVLVGGRWLALETAERAWAATFPGGAALVEARTLARLLHGLVLLFSITWSTGNVFVVYRAIGSVQMPRRLGDLEIVEAVPQRVLLALTVGAGIVGGIILAWGTGDWWRAALLAAAPPHFGQTDRILGLDFGYYVGVLPWHLTLQGHAMALTAGAAVAVALLYTGIGSLRIQRGRLEASDHARGHCAVLFACLALALAWGATLDPAEVVAGLHGPVDQASLDVRIHGAVFVAAVAVATALASLAWGWRDHPNLLLGAWAALLLAAVGCYLIVPGLVRASGSGEGGQETLVQRREALEREAFGLAPLDEGAPPGFASPTAAAQEAPLWDVERVSAVAGVPASTVTLWAGRTWLVGPSRTAGRGTPRLARETDPGITFATVAATDTAPWFGPGGEFGEAVFASPDTWPALRRSGIPLGGAWRRWALAQTLQSFEPISAATEGRIVLWRRDVADRLARLAPFATFGAPAPAVADSALWWVSWGYLSSETFPLARALPWRGHPVRYMRAGLVGAVRAATGETHLWLAPGYDSLTAAWGRHFAPLIEPPERMPGALRGALDYPPELFQLAAAQLVRAGAETDSTVWTLRPRQPFHLAAARRWTAVALEAGTPRRFVGLLAGAMTGEGPRLRRWRPGVPERLPGEVVGSSETSPGELRIWPAGGVVLTVQAQFAQPAGERAQPQVERVYLSLGDRTGDGPTAPAALLALLTGQGRRFVTDTTLAGRWEQARVLAARADSALAAGDVEAFGRLYRELVRLLAPARRPR
jgi:uncharacterized membrane protein (UPF0182 family)